jgi:hypothetical protein
MALQITRSKASSPRASRIALAELQMSSCPIDSCAFHESMPDEAARCPKRLEIRARQFVRCDPQPTTATRTANARRAPPDGFGDPVEQQISISRATLVPTIAARPFEGEGRVVGAGHPRTTTMCIRRRARARPSSMSARCRRCARAR